MKHTMILILMGMLCAVGIIAAVAGVYAAYFNFIAIACACFVAALSCAVAFQFLDERL